MLHQLRFISFLYVADMPLLVFSTGVIRGWIPQALTRGSALRESKPLQSTHIVQPMVTWDRKRTDVAESIVYASEPCAHACACSTSS